LVRPSFVIPPSPVITHPLIITLTLSHSPIVTHRHASTHCLTNL
jgi:hypothetical protein